MNRSIHIVALMLASALAAGLVACTQPTEPEEEEMAGLENGSFTAELNGFNIHYEVHGTGPVVMTVTNSWGLSLEGLREMYLPLEERVTMVYFDPRGMGGSDPVREDEDMSAAAVRADFHALREHLGLEKVHAIGWSNGATNLVLLASEKPETLHSAIFLHGAASVSEEDMKMFGEKYPDLMQKYADFLDMLQDDTVSDEDKDAAQRRLWLGEMFPLSFADKEAGKAKIAEIFKDAQLSWRHARYAQIEFPSFDFTDRLPLITVPALIVAGTHDMMSIMKGEEMHAGIPNSTYVVFENSGHYAMVEEKDLFLETFDTFLGL